MAPHRCTQATCARGCVAHVVSTADVVLPRAGWRVEIEAAADGTFPVVLRADHEQGARLHSVELRYLAVQLVLGPHLRAAIRGERAPQSCATCGAEYRPTGYQSRYCSVRCRAAAQKRRHRERQRARGRRPESV
jgi:hypothetical protein